MIQRKLKEVDYDSDGDDCQSVDLENESREFSFGKKQTLYQGLSPIRCFNYYTQLLVAGHLITESLNTGKSAVLILDKNAEKSLKMLESFGITLRQALLDRRLDIYYYRDGVRNENFCREDYQAILEAALCTNSEAESQSQPPGSSIQNLIMIEFNTLFENTVKDAISNQIEDYCAAARQYDVSITGLYSPLSWYHDDFLSTQLPAYLGSSTLREARFNQETKEIDYTTRPTLKLVS